MLARVSEGMACHPKLFAEPIESPPSPKATVGTLCANHERRVAERVGFALLPGIENKELIAFLLPHDPPHPHESPGRDTY